MPHHLPEQFILSLRTAAGFDEQAFLQVHDENKAVTSIRLNPAKPTNTINTLPVESVVPWCAAGCYLSERPSFTLDPVFHGGAYYVQEASSMFLDHIVKELYKSEPAPRRVLDLCAAPGGKSTLLAAALPDSFIVANEVIRTRVGVLAENISKWGSDNVVVTNNDPADFKKLPGYFNLMVVDAPCSGSGLFRKDTNAIDEWSRANVQICSMRQQRILADVVGSLQQNGYLIYSTCSYSEQEDEDICDWLVEEFKLRSVSIAIDPASGIVETCSLRQKATGYRFYPDKLKGEGFFVAVFKQLNEVDQYYDYYNKLTTINKQALEIVASFLLKADEYILSDQKEFIIAAPKKWQEELETTSKILNVRKSGVAVGTIKGKDLIPHHELALSHLLAHQIPVVNLTRDGALNYLRRLELSEEISGKGWTICRYEDINLGWMKVLPNRINNYYPTNWRILKA